MAALLKGLRGRLLTGVFLAYCLGVLLARLFGLPLYIAVLLLLTAPGLVLLGGSRGWDLRPALLLFGCVLGCFFACFQESRLAAADFRENEVYTLEGRVLSSLETGDGARMTLLLRQADGETRRCAPVYVYSRDPLPGPGVRLRIAAQTLPRETDGAALTYDYQEHLRYQGIGACFYADRAPEILREPPVWSPQALLTWLRRSLDQALSRLRPEEKALVQGVFLGDKHGLDQEQRNVLGLAGISHAFAASGLHISYVLLLAALLLPRRYRFRWRRLLLSLCLLLFYLSLTGWLPAVLRAAIMALSLLLAQVGREKTDWLTTLSLAGLLSLVWRPFWLFDPGFQLSYGAMLGVSLYGRAFRQSLPARWGRLREALAVSLSASLPVLPLTAYFFYHISWLGCFLSLLAVPAAGLAVLLSFCGVLLSPLLPAAAAAVLRAAAAPLLALYDLADVLSKLPFCASLTGTVPFWLTGAVLLLLLLLPRLWRELGEKRTLRWQRQALLCSAAALVLVFSLLPPCLNRGRAGETEVVFLDVGQGDASLVITEEGYTALIDGGGSQTVGEVGDYILLPYLKSRGIDRIDLLVSTHPDRDHIDGLLSVLEGLPVGAVCYSPWAEDNAQQRSLLALAEARGSALLPVWGQCLHLGREVQLSFFPPDPQAQESNDASLVCRLTCGGVSVLFPGDAGAEQLLSLSQGRDLRADVLHLPHHGSLTGYDPALYRRTGSAFAVLSVGAGNPYGHPAEPVVQYWNEHGSLYRTDLQGTVTLSIRVGEFSFATARLP